MRFSHNRRDHTETLRLEYKHYSTLVAADAGDNRVYGERVKAGWILLVLTCFLHMPNAADNDVAEILIDDGGHELEIRSRARDKAKQGMSAVNPFYLGEHQRVIGQTSRIAKDERICLTVIGELIPLKKWRKGKV